MLSQNSWQTSAQPTKMETADQDTADIEALRAAYWAVVTASAHSVFSNHAMGPNQKPVSEPILNAYQAAVAAFASSIFSSAGAPQEAAGIPYIPPMQTIQQQANTLMDVPQATQAAPPPLQNRPESLTFKLPAGESSQWVPEAMQAKRTTRASRQLPRPIIRKKNEERPTSSQPIESQSKATRTSPFPPLKKDLYEQTEVHQPQKGINKTDMHHKVQAFFNELQPEPNTTEKHDAKPIHPVQQPEPAMNQAETAQMLDMLHEESLIENLPEMHEGWLSKTLSRPKVVTGIIGLCLLASSIYAGLGYWWLNATSISQAAEPNSGIENSITPRNNGSLLKNIETLQNETHIIIPNEQAEVRETLLAQAGPSKTFTMAELKSELTGPTGRPDPFSPLIQEGNNNFSPLGDPNKKKDILLDVQYTGFIGDVNSKDKVAIIRVTDPAGGTKTLIKKAGDSFYVDGERIVLNAIAKNNLSLRVSGANRKLSLNPYQEITTASASTGTAQQSVAAPTTSGSTPSSGDKPLSPSPSSGSRNANPATPTLQEP